MSRVVVLIVVYLVASCVSRQPYLRACVCVWREECMQNRMQTLPVGMCYVSYHLLLT